METQLPCADGPLKSSFDICGSIGVDKGLHSQRVAGDASVIHLTSSSCWTFATPAAIAPCVGLSPAASGSAYLSPLCKHFWVDSMHKQRLYNMQ